MSWNYTQQPEAPHAKAVAPNVSISHKHAREIGAALRGQTLKRAKTILSKLSLKKEAIPFKRFARDVAHRKGAMGAGRYPIKAGAAILNLIKSAESNAQDKGLVVDNLYVAYIATNRAARNFKPGRQGRRRNKNTHVEVILMEKAKTASKKETKTAAKKEEAKKE